MPTAPAGVGESEPRQLPARGKGERETAEREEYVGLEKEPESEKRRIKGVTEAST